jgi:hypothetical protein
MYIIPFVIAFEADKDMVPGWGDNVEDWVSLATREFRRQSHYNTALRVISTETRPYAWDDETGWSPPSFEAGA